MSTAQQKVWLLKCWHSARNAKLKKLHTFFDHYKVKFAKTEYANIVLYLDLKAYSVKPVKIVNCQIMKSIIQKSVVKYI